MFRKSIYFALIIFFCMSASLAASAGVTITPSPVAFGDQTVNQSATKSINVTNTGASTVQLQSASMSGASAFKLTGWNGTVSLAPGATKTLALVFTPPQPWSYSGSLSIGSSAGTSTASMSGHGATGSTTSVAVTVVPALAVVQTSTTVQLSASVTGSTNQAVTWYAGGVMGGNSTVGTISASGLYKAPASVPSAPVTVKAISAADSTKSASASVTVTNTPTAVSISITPTSKSLTGLQTAQFSATVQGTSNTGVAWYVNGVQGGSSTYGPISSSGLYTAPACPSSSSVTVTAKSVYDSSATANAAVSLTAAGATANDYYVATSGSDSNNGSVCHPWATIAHASSVIGPGATVHVSPGTYTGQITTKASGTSTARITYVSDSEWGAKIKSTQTGDASTWQNYGNYVDIIGFDITGAGNVGLFNKASHTKMIANHVHNIPAALCDSQGGAGIDNGNYSATDADIINNVVHDIGDPNRNCVVVQGIYHAVNGGHIYNNIVYRVNSWGIQLWHAARNVTISNNLVYSNGQGGMNIGAGDSPGGVTADNIIVSNNMLLNNGYSWSTSPVLREWGTTGPNNRYYNNLLFGNKKNQMSLKTGSQSNTMYSDPLLVNFKTDGTGDYHLTPGSPAINRGTNTGAPLFDWNGGVRPLGGAPDIGIYEYQSTPTSYPWNF